jgi:uncharacterized protein YjbI with pentapeptide repeats
MSPEFFADKTFSKINNTLNPIVKGEYECCLFSGCDFSNSSVAGVKFIECEFENCNFSLTKLTSTTFIDAKFRNCKMLGLHFDSCNQLGLTVFFENCNLNHSSFYKLKIKKTVFKNIQLQEVDFTEGDISEAIFDNCDFTHAVFDNTNLEKADLLTSFNYSINPEKNRIKKAKFSLHGIPGLLNQYDIEIDISN